MLISVHAPDQSGHLKALVQRGHTVINFEGFFFPFLADEGERARIVYFSPTDETGERPRPRSKSRRKRIKPAICSREKRALMCGLNPSIFHHVHEDPRAVWVRSMCTHTRVRTCTYVGVSVRVNVSMHVGMCVYNG